MILCTDRKEKNLSLRQRVESIWSNDGRPRSRAEMVLCGGLRLASAAYWVGATARGAAYDIGALPARRVDCPVVSVGNLTVGGTGKTPMAMEVARLLTETGLRPAIVSRGYRRSRSAGVTIVSDGRAVLAEADAAGDEPLMMARRVPGVAVVVGSCRYEAALTARRECNADVIVLDDGFQHRALARDCDIVLWDTLRRPESLDLFPRGPMREGLRGLRRAHALVFTRCNLGRSARRILGRIKRYAPNLVVFHADLLIDALLPLEVCGAGVSSSETAPPEDRSRLMAATEGTQSVRTGAVENALAPECLRDRRVATFCGLGNPASFRRLLETAGAAVVADRVFPDHYRPSREELDRWFRDAQSEGAEMVLTTEKDRENLPDNWQPGLPVRIVRVRIGWGSDADRFRSFLMRYVEAGVSTAGSEQQSGS